MAISISIRPFRIRFEIAVSVFPDCESFARSFAKNGQLEIREFHQTEKCYVFDDGWMVALNPSSQLELCSPILNKRNASEVTRVIDTLRNMNVNIGETCSAHLQYEGILERLGVSRLLQKVSLEYWSGFWLVVFLILKMVEFQTLEPLSTGYRTLLQILGYFCVACFSICFYKAFLSRLPFSSQLHSTAKDANHPISGFFRKSKAQDRSAVSHAAPWQVELIKQIRTPLENVMAYTRFYQRTVRPDSQHAKDLAELAEHAIRIQESLNRVESNSNASTRTAGETRLSEGLNSFRRTPRVLELIPTVVKGQDPLGQDFDTPSYALNTSSTGACLLLPDRIVKVGQRIILSNHRFTSEADVRWVIQGKTGNMAFAGVQFITSAPLRKAKVLGA